MKKRKANSRSASDSDGEEDDVLTYSYQPKSANLKHGDDSPGGDWIDASFDFCDPCEDDIQNVKALLINGGLYPGSLVTDSVVKCLCNQGNIGAIVKAENEESDSAVAVLSILNVQQYDEMKCVKNFLLSLARQHASSSVFREFETILNSPTNSVGYFVNERFINLPPSLVPQMFTVIQEDILWSQNIPEMPVEERPFYSFSHLIGYSIFYSRDEGIPFEKKQKAGSMSDNISVFYRKFEEEELFNASELCFCWSTNQQVRLNCESQSPSENSNSPKTQTFQEKKMIYVVPYSKLSSVIKHLKEREPIDLNAKIETLTA
ncbi:hypothetical protein IE077_000796 [Cardiosporidium cionae]|uniref:Protein BCCIP homolog n=1 Tax=Cardiosporidium cionae TaxID=476202 RepID=A0ABQ7J6J2_9APIC|nr:hypothetical protein IE077_000796 [Cardiosporidium cionae]|eukprot:KAF8819588.1 hypothetical protein IE077_000796 [Cardiosporidium cionae]